MVSDYIYQTSVSNDIFQNKTLMKIIQYIILLFCFATFTAKSQVAINTKSPLGNFHIDAAGDNAATPTAAQLINDVIINNNGYVGIGTSPSRALHLKSTVAGKAFRLEDGNEFQDKILMTDGNGIATWKTLSSGGRLINLTLHHSGFAFTGATQIFEAESNADVSYQSTIKNTTYTTRSLTLPKGNYMIFLTAIAEDLTLQPYFSVQIIGAYTSGGTVLSSVYRGEPSLSANDFFSFTDEVRLSIRIRLFNAANNVNTALVTPLNPPSTFGFNISINALKLSF